MNKMLALGSLFCMALTAQPAIARNTVTNYPIDEIRAQPEYAEKIGDFRFEFGNVPKGKILGDTVSLQATNGVNKSDERACIWAA